MLLLTFFSLNSFAVSEQVDRSMYMRELQEEKRAEQQKKKKKAKKREYQQRSGGKYQPKSKKQRVK